MAASVAYAPLAMLIIRSFIGFAIAPVRANSGYAVAISIDGGKWPVDLG